MLCGLDATSGVKKYSWHGTANMSVVVNDQYVYVGNHDGLFQLNVPELNLLNNYTDVTVESFTKRNQ